MLRVKKIISLILAFAMMLTLPCAGVFADAELNGKTIRSTEIELGKPYKANIKSIDDIKLYSFSCNEGEVYAITVFDYYTHHLIDNSIWLDFYHPDAACEFITFPMSELMTSTYILSAEESGVYQLMIRTHDESGDVDINITFRVDSLSNPKAEPFTLAPIGGVWKYFGKDGTPDKTFNGLVYQYGCWWTVKNGVVDFHSEDLVFQYGYWWYVKEGYVRFDHEGVFKKFGEIWYVKDGRVDFSYTGSYSGYNFAGGMAQ